LRAGAQNAYGGGRCTRRGLVAPGLVLRTVSECCARLVLTGFVAAGLQPATVLSCPEAPMLNGEIDYLGLKSSHQELAADDIILMAGSRSASSDSKS
jgi:hypothetical protein